MHSDILSVVKNVQSTEKVIRPHLAERWQTLTPEQRERINTFGSYRVDKDFSAHISVAQVDDDVARDMFSLARVKITVPVEFSFRELQLVDVGHENERWNVIWRKGITVNSDAVR